MMTQPRATTKTTFADLLAAKLSAGDRVATSTALAIVHVKTGVSIGSLWSAYRGYRVAPETAEKLREWAFVEHGVEDLDVERLVFAPAKPRKGRTR